MSFLTTDMLYFNLVKQERKKKSWRFMGQNANRPKKYEYFFKVLLFVFFLLLKRAVVTFVGDAG